jgi:uncharacterized protein
MTAPESAILAALYHRNRDEAVRLAEAAADLTIWEAAALGRDADLRRLLERDTALANAWAPDGHTPLGLAAFFADAPTVGLLLEHGADLTAAARNPMRVQPLHAAVASGHAETARLLLERGAGANVPQQAGYTPLMGAAAAGRKDLVELLLAHGADPSIASDDGKTAVDLARERGHRDLAEYLAATRPSEG